MERPTIGDSTILGPVPTDSVSVAGGFALGIATITFDPNQTRPVYQVLALSQASILAIVVAIALLGVQIAASEQTVLVARRLREQGYLTREIEQFVAGIGLGIAGLLAVPFLTDWIPILGPLGLLAVGGLTGLYATANFRSLVPIKDRFLEVVDPETVLEDLAASVETEEYLAFGDGRNVTESPERSPVLEITAIGRNAFADGDDYTGRSACHRLRTVTIALFEDIGEWEEISLAEFPLHDLFDHWERLIDAAVENGSDRSITRLGHELQTVGETIATTCPDASYESYLSTIRYLHDSARSHERLRAVPNSLHTSILEGCREHGKHKFAQQAVISASLSAESLSANPSTSHPRTDHGVSTATAILKSLFEQWAEYVASEHQDSEEYDTLPRTFEDRIGRYLARCASTDRPVPKDTGQNLQRVGEAAAEAGDQHTVSRVTRMIIEVQILIQEESDEDLGLHLADALSQIIDAGGREGVDAGFDEILAADPASEIGADTEFPPTHQNMVDANVEDRTYRNVIPTLRSLNSVDDFEHRVRQYQDIVERFYTKHFED